MAAFGEIIWVNHASFLYSIGATRLLSDPWLTGTAFNNGWRHISETRFTSSGFADVTHLWLSHQHPDHFAPQDLKRVPPEARRRLEVLYQTVPDKLVVSWLRSAGYRNVRELEMDRWVRLSDDLEVMCGALADDSWLAMKAGESTILNVNDCVLKRKSDIERIRRLVGPVHLLLTQFSYAQWSGNADDTDTRRREAREKFDRIRLQCEILKPQIVVPFASFIYFCNTENFFMNDAMNSVAEVAEYIEADLRTRAVVLYPGDVWNVGDAIDWRPAAERYAADAEARLAAGPVDTPRLINANEFVLQVNDFVRRVRRKHPYLDAILREHTSFYLTDHCGAYRLSSRGLRRISAAPTQVDIATSSENILYAFRTPWGGNTLHVSGRFQSHVPGGHLRFFRLLAKLHYYNKTALDRRWIGAQYARVRRGISRKVSRLRGEKAAAQG